MLWFTKNTLTRRKLVEVSSCLDGALFYFWTSFAVAPLKDKNCKGLCIPLHLSTFSLISPMCTISLRTALARYRSEHSIQTAHTSLLHQNGRDRATFVLDAIGPRGIMLYWWLALTTCTVVRRIFGYIYCWPIGMRDRMPINSVAFWPALSKLGFF